MALPGTYTVVSSQTKLVSYGDSPQLIFQHNRDIFSFSFQTNPMKISKIDSHSFNLLLNTRNFPKKGVHYQENAMTRTTITSHRARN